MTTDYITVDQPATPVSPRRIGMIQGLVMPDATTADAQVIAVALGTGAGNASPILGGRDLGSGVGALNVADRSEIYSTTLVATVMTASGYTAGMALGTTIDFGTVARASGAGIEVVGFTVLDVTKQLAAGTSTLLLFNGAPAAATDHTAYNPSPTDLAKMIGAVALGPWTSFSTRAVSAGGPALFGVSADGHLYGQLMVVTGTPTFVSTADVSVGLTVRRF